MALLALGGRPQPLKKPSQSQKGHFYEKMNALNDTKTSAMSKSAEGNGEYLWSSVAFVKVWMKSKSQNANTGLKTTQMLHKNKACQTHEELRQTLYSLLKAQFFCLRSFLGLGAEASCALIKWCSSFSINLSSSGITQLPNTPPNSIDTTSGISGRPSRSPAVKHAARNLK